MKKEDTSSCDLSLAFFHELIEVHGGRSAFDGLTTLDVCMRFVKPTTSSSQLSLVDHVRSQPGGDEYAKPAQWLISHSWSYQFLDVVDAIDNFCLEQDLSPDTSFWFCMFANNQHAIGDPAKMFEVFLQAFRTALEATGKIVMVLSPWHDPETLKRTWCVYEVYLSIVLNARFEIAMGKAQKAAFLEDIQDYQSMERMRSQVNCKNSITTVPSDRDHIFKLIDDAVGGTAALDRIVFDGMQTWVLQAIDQQLEVACDAEDRFRWLFTKAGTLHHVGLFDQAIEAYQAAIDLFRTELPRSFWRGWEAICWYAERRAQLRHARELWEPMLDEAIPMLQELLGRDHPVTLGAMRDGGASLIKIRHFDHAKALLDECYEHEKLKPQDFRPKYTTMHHLGDWHLMQNSLADAAAWYQQAFDGYARLYDRSHDRCMASLSNLAVCCIKQGQYREAEEKMATVLAEAERTLGPTHSQTLRRKGNVAAIKRSLAKYDEADDMLRHCIHHFQALNDDYGGAICLRHRGLVKWCQRDYVQAKELLEQVTMWGVAINGPTSFLGRVGLLDSYMIWLEMASEFDSIEKIDHFVGQLKAAELGHETWNDVLCHGCYKVVQGDLTMCSKCPRLAVQFCETCATTKPNAFCAHVDGPWIVLKPPMRYLLEQKLTLLATQKSNGWQGLHDSTAALYSAYCYQFNVTDRYQVEHRDVPEANERFSHVNVRWGFLALVGAATWLCRCQKV